MRTGQTNHEDLGSDSYRACCNVISHWEVDMSLDVVGNEISTLVIQLNSILTGLCQLLALFVIAIGVTKALLIFLKDALLWPKTPDAFQRSRLAMGYSFSLGLSFGSIAVSRRLLNSSRRG